MYFKSRVAFALVAKFLINSIRKWYSIHYNTANSIVLVLTKWITKMSIHKKLMNKMRIYVPIIVWSKIY